MVKTIRYGIIGCGMMGREHIRNIALLENVTVAAIYEPDPSMAAAAKKLVPSAKFTASFMELVRYDGLDAFIIVSPNHLHLDQLEKIAETRPLPVLVEKPVYTDTDDLVRIERLIQSYPSPIWVAMEYRYMPPISAFLDQVDLVTGGIKMLTIREHRFPFLEKVGDWNRFNRNTGGTLVEKCCHFFDLMRFAIGAEPVRVMASAGQAINHLDESYNGEVPDVWDNGYVLVDFENGVRAMLELCMFAEGSRYQEEISAVGSAGKIEALVPGPGRFWPSDQGPAPLSKVIISPRSHENQQEIDIATDPEILKLGDHNGATFFQHLHFLETVRSGKPPHVSLSDGAWAVRIGMAAQQSAVENRVINFGSIAKFS